MIKLIYFGIFFQEILSLETFAISSERFNVQFYAKSKISSFH